MPEGFCLENYENMCLMSVLGDRYLIPLWQLKYPSELKRVIITYQTCMLPSHITAQTQEDCTDQLKLKCGDECMGHRYINTSRMTTHGFSVKSKVSRSYPTDEVITSIPDKEATLNDEFYWEKVVCNEWVSVHFNESIKVFLRTTKDRIKHYS